MTSVPLPYSETPLLHSLYLSDLAGAQIYLKLETTQPSGSFKSRGLGNLVYQTVTGKNPRAPLPSHIANGSSPLPNGHFHFFSPSGGNAGCATAYAARQYKQNCTVCLPTAANPIMVERIRKTGANVIVHGATIAEADKYIQETLIPACKEVAVYCHPYNDPIVWQGNSTVMDEIVKQVDAMSPSAATAVSTASSVIPEKIIPVSSDIPTPSTSPKAVPNTAPNSCNLPPSPTASSLSLNAISPSTSTSLKPAAIMCSVGGGGLYNGIVQGLMRHHWSDTTCVVAVETEGCATLHKSIESIQHGGHSVEVEKPTTIAVSLATKNVTDQTLEYAMSSNSLTPPSPPSASLIATPSSSLASPLDVKPPATHSLVVSDKDAASACINFVDDHKILVEAACGTALAPIYNGTIRQVLPNLKEDDKVVVILCGGSAVSFNILKEYSDKFGIPFF